MKLPSLAIRNSQFTLTVALLLVLVGIVSYLNMPRSEDPQFDVAVTLVEVIYPGASPLDIETLVVNPLEQEISEIENIKKIEAKINNGSVRITIDFLYGTDAEAAFNKVKQSVATIKPSLPLGITGLSVIKATPSGVAIMQLALWSDPVDYKKMEVKAKLLERQLESLPSVRQVNLWGYPQQIIAVDVNVSKLKHYGVSLQDVTQILAKAAENITPGFIEASFKRFNVKVSGGYTALIDIEKTVVARNKQNILRIKDIAEVSFSSNKPSYLAYLGDKPAIFITVEQRPNTNIFQLTEQLNRVINNFISTLDGNVTLTKLFQQADSVKVRVNGFFENLVYGLIIVALMALLFLGIREAIVVTLAIPISFLVAIGWLDFTGFGLQQMSIVGLIIALGLLVDNAIVVTESIHREHKITPCIKQAAAKGASDVSWAITSGSITTMLAFLPMLMIQSNTGDFIRSMPVTVVLVLLASLIVALTFTPLLASKLLISKSDSTGNYQKVKTLQHYANTFAETVYSQILLRLMRYKVAVFVGSVLVLGGLFSLFTHVGVSLFPKAEKPMLLINVKTPANSSIAYTDSVMQQVRQHVEQYNQVDKVALNIGNSNPRIYYNEIPKRGMSRLGQALLILNSYDENEMSALVYQLRNEFTLWQHANITVKEFTQGPVTDQVISIRLLSESLADLEKVANDLSNYMHSLEGPVNIDNPIGLANTELALGLNYQQLALSDIQVNDFDNTLHTLLTGTSIGQFNDKNGEDYPIVVRAKGFDLNDLNRLNVTNTGGVAIPIGQIADIRLTKADSEFFHFQKLRMAKVSADVARGYSVSSLTASLEQYLKNYHLPKGMSYTVGGEEESRQNTFAGLTKIMLITAMGIFAVLVLQFKSVVQPMIIFSSIPFAIAGAILGLYLAGLSFSMMAFVGLISLFGIVVNNAIILIDNANMNMKLGLPKKHAILKASAVRFTPILLTTLTTIGGLIPLTIFGGSLWQPLGMVIIFGLFISALSSFLLVPLLTEVFTPNKLSGSIITK